MKILFIHNRYKQYGGEDVAVELESSLLKSRGHEVRLMIFENKSIQNFFSKLVTAFRSVYNVGSARQVNKLIRQFKPDIIHIHNLFFIASPSVLFVARRHHIPVILTLHNYRLICVNALLLRNNEVCELCIHKKFPYAGIKYKCYRESATASALVTTITGMHKLIQTWKNKITTFITLNDFSRSKLLHSSLQVPENKLITKPNFVSDPGDGIQPREKFFLFAGRIVNEKGVHVLAKAFAGMPTIQLVIIGDGPEKKYLEETYMFSSNISFTGHLQKKEVSEYMKRCKAFICPSVWYEGAPLTIIEAFATGTPVIASRLGAMAESIRDGFNGLHFKPGDADDLIEKVNRFIKETETNTMLYKNARHTYLEKYHPDIHYHAIIKIYEAAIAAG